MHSAAFQVSAQVAPSVAPSSQSSLFCKNTRRLRTPQPARKRRAAAAPAAILGPLRALDVQADFSAPAASGSFGEVFFGTLRSGEAVVLKRARSGATARALFDAERSANVRLRAARDAPARWPAYLGTFSRHSEPFLVWARAGAARTLEDYLSGCAPGALAAAVGAADARDARLRAAAFRVVVGELLRAADALRAAGLVHRDVKPDNVLVVPGAAHPLQMIDFGSACDTRPAFWRRPPHVLDPLYAPPERRVSARAPDRFDVFSIALVGLRVLLPDLSASRLRDFRTCLLAADCSLYRVRDEMRRAQMLGADPALAALFDPADPAATQIFHTLAGMLVKSPADRSSASKVLNASPLFRGGR